MAMAAVSVLWEVPLGGLSYFFSRGVKWILTFVSRYYNPANAKAQPDWQIVSADFLASPIKLLWTMSRARWNLHALIAIAGPFSVQSQLTIEVKALHQSAPSWTAVVYTLKGYRTLTSMSSLTIPPAENTATLELPPGRYLVGVRHYDWSSPIRLPAISVDGKAALDAQTMAAPPDFNQFYRDLALRRGRLYSCLNYYVYPLLRWQRWLPSGWVRRTFLPVPNPETHFYYGALDQGETLEIDAPASLLTTHRLYFSLYSRDCFPLDWYPITTSHHITHPLPEKAVYILRVHPQSAAAVTTQRPPIQFVLNTASPSLLQT